MMTEPMVPELQDRSAVSPLVQKQIVELGRYIADAERIVVFSGAGISTASGIPDFRSPTGIWSRFDPSDFYIDKLLQSAESRAQYWRRSIEMYACICEARPSAAHAAVALLHTQSQTLLSVITQNIDELHQQSGLPAEKVIELHGTSHRVSCMQCSYEVPRKIYQPLIDADGHAPPCEKCGGIMKPATISFGQSLIHEVLEAAQKSAEQCDLCLVVGSSLVVQPAALIPLQAMQAGAILIIINLEPTPYDQLAALTIHAAADPVLEGAMLAALGTPI